MVAVVPSGLTQPAVTPIVELAQGSEFVRVWLEARHISRKYVHVPPPEGRDVDRVGGDSVVANCANAVIERTLFKRRARNICGHPYLRSSMAEIAVDTSNRSSSLLTSMVTSAGYRSVRLQSTSTNTNLAPSLTS